MGIGSVFITRRTDAASQTVIEQVEPGRPYEAAVPKGNAPQAAIAPASQAKIISAERLGTR